MKISACFISLDYVNFTSNLFSGRFKKKSNNTPAFSFWNRMWIKPHGGSWINIWNFFDRVGTWILRFINLKNDVFVYPHGSSTCDSRVHLPNFKNLDPARQDCSKKIAFEYDFCAYSMKKVENTWTSSDSEDALNNTFRWPWKWPDGRVDGRIRA